MKKISLVCALFLSASFAFGEGTTAAYSTNTFAMVKLSSPATNTLIAVPWVGYTEDALPSREEFVDHLVKPDNLTLWENEQEGDMLLLVGTNLHYKSWHLVEKDGIRQWARAKDVIIPPQGNGEDPEDVADDCIARGYGLWLIRRDPLKGPFYLEGQYTSGPTSVTVRAAAPGTTNAVMVAHPVCSGRGDLDINKDITWRSTEINPGDTLSVPCVNSKWDYCKWHATSNKWYRTKTMTEQRQYGQKTITIQKLINDYDITIPVGQGFWYVNRGANDVTITFE